MDSPLTTSLREARRRTSAADRRPAPADGARSRVPGDLPPVLALQRLAGNSAVSALLAAKMKGGADGVVDIDAALPEARKNEPDLSVLEKGLKAAKTAGVPVDIDGEQQKPPASALAVTKTGFGPAMVPAKKPVPPTKPTPARSPLGKAGARPQGPKGGGAGKKPAGPAVPTSGAGAAAPISAGPVDVMAPPVPPPRLAPAADPAFTAVTGAVVKHASAQKAHPPAAAKAKEAQDAAVAPSDHIDSQAKAAKVDTMDATPAGSFDKKAFIAAVKAAVEAKSPRNLEEADEYKKSGKAGEVKGEVKGLVGGNKQQAAGPIEGAAQAPPDESKAIAKPVTPMQQEEPGQPPVVPAAGAVPKPAPAEQVNLEAGKQQTSKEMGDAEVSEDQLAKSNEPEFTGAVAAKQEAAQHADTAPGQFRQQESAVLEQSKADATATTTGGLTGMHGAKAAVLAKVTGQKGDTKSKDETRRADVATKIQNIFKATEADVKKILEGLDPKVEKAFDEGEKGAKAQFEAYVEAKMSAFKKDRYGGWLGGYKWLKDKIAGPPAKVNEIFEAGREVYIKEMDKVISNVADIVGGDLHAAKKRIADGKAEIAAFVKSLPNDLQQVGAEAAKEVGDQFEKLEGDVAAKQDALVDTLASKYTDARKGLDDRIEELQAENQGLVDKAIGAIKAVVGTILKLKDMLLGVLARAASAVGKIIKDPIGFLGNFVNAIKGGIQNFASNIWEHLKKGLQAWLFGALAEGGVEIPDTLDLKGLLKLVASIFGLTWTFIRSRITKKIGEPVMAKVEQGLDFIKLLATEGLAGIWQLILKKVGDLKDMVVNQIQEMVVTQIVKAGIVWLISMLNPAGAFIKACKMIYDVVMFFVEKADQIKEFVDAVLDSVESIAGGGVGAVASKIEQTLAKMLPVLIGFLASLLGLGGISEKIKKIIQTIQKPIGKAIDWVVGKAVSYGKRFLGFAGKMGKKIKGAAKKVGAKIKKKLGIKEKTPEQVEKDKKNRLDKGVAAGVSAANRFAGKSVTSRLLSPIFTALKLRYRMTALELVPRGDRWAVHGAVNPEKTDDTEKRKSGPIDGQILRQIIHEVVVKVTSRGDVQRERAAQEVGVNRPGAGGVPRVVNPGVGFVALGGAAPPMAGFGQTRYSVLPESRFAPPSEFTAHGAPRRRPEAATWADPVIEQQKFGTSPFVRTSPADYPGLATKLSTIAKQTGRTDAQLAKAISNSTRTGHLPVDLEPHSAHIQQFQYLLFGTESQRRPDSIAYAMMTMQHVERGGSFQGAFGEFKANSGGGYFPMSMKNAEGAARDLNAEAPGAAPEGRTPNAQELARREAAMAEAWLRTELSQDGITSLPTEDEARKFIEAKLLKYFSMPKNSPVSASPAA
jgi:hypothetical protein